MRMLTGIPSSSRRNKTKTAKTTETTATTTSRPMLALTGTVLAVMATAARLPAADAVIPSTPSWHPAWNHRRHAGGASSNIPSDARLPQCAFHLYRHLSKTAGTARLTPAFHARASARFLVLYLSLNRVDARCSDRVSCPPTRVKHLTQECINSSTWLESDGIIRAANVDG